MGILDRFLSIIDNTRRVAARNVDDLVNDTENAVSKTLHATIDTVKELPNDPSNFLGKGIVVSHGSGKLFSKFDLTKAGTGEGSASKGYGVYVAEEPKVGISYAKQSLENGRDALGPEKQAYHYKVNLPDWYLNKLIDLDKPLNSQSSVVHNAIRIIAEQEGLPIQYRLNGAGKKLYGDTVTGEDFYNAMVSRLGDQKTASAILNSYGIIGNKYLDDVSRTVGKGTSNFVIFDPALLHILETEVVKK